MAWHGITDGKDRVDVLTDKSLPVTERDSIAPLVIAPFHKTNNISALTVATEEDDYSITVAVTTGFVDTAYIVLLDTIGNNFYIGQQVGAPVGNVITVDKPITDIFPVGTKTIAGSTNLAVDGSVTTQVFSITPDSIDVNIPINITRIIITMVTDTACDLSTFGDIATGLVNGVTLRHKHNVIEASFLTASRNILNVKTNADLATLMYDLTFHTATNPVEGQDGLVGRLTFGSMSKMGAVIRIGPGEDLQCLINDDLSSITQFNILAEGHMALNI